MIDWLEKFRLWKDNVSAKDKTTLKNLETKQRKDFFDTELKFGTAGIRAKFGLGTNRINIYTIGKYVQAFSEYLVKNFSKERLLNEGVIIFHDNRKHGESFSTLAAQIFSSYNIKATLSYKNYLQPTPLLSYFIFKHNKVGGINITASHNSKEYSGIKFYNQNGSQIEDWESQIIQEIYDSLEFFAFSKSKKNITNFGKDFEDEYIDEIIKPMIKKQKTKLRVLFSPQHGTSLYLIKKISELLNIDLDLVKKQSYPDANFTNTINPNPGSIEAFQEAIPIAINQNIPVIISIDPDGDRIGFMIKDDNNWVHINGNEIAILILYYLIKTTRTSKLKKSYIVKSIVTSDQGKRMADKHGIEVLETATGFKNLSNTSLKYKEEQVNTGIKLKKMKTPLLIYEESYGLIINDSVRDKDAFQVFVLLTKIISFLSSEGLTISGALNRINQKYGYTKSFQDSKEVSSFIEIDNYLISIVNYFKNATNLKNLKEIKFDYIEDFESPRDQNISPSKGLKLWFKGGTWISVRPSGTEPIMKFYYDFFNITQDAQKELLDIFEKIYLNLN